MTDIRITIEATMKKKFKYQVEQKARLIRMGIQKGGEIYEKTRSVLLDDYDSRPKGAVSRNTSSFNKAKQNYPNLKVTGLRKFPYARTYDLANQLIHMYIPKKVTYTKHKNGWVANVEVRTELQKVSHGGYVYSQGSGKTLDRYYPNYRALLLARAQKFIREVAKRK